MNVLVYNGQGVSKICLEHTLSALKALLLPHFAVQAVTASMLASQPWPDTCALLVIPGGRDLPYLSSLRDATPIIKAYVEEGGSFLGLCAGAYYASRRVEWEVGSEIEVIGDRPLAFFKGVCRGSVYRGFAYGSEAGARAVAVEDAETGEVVKGMYHNGGGEFVLDDVNGRLDDGDEAVAVAAGSGRTAKAKVLARYIEDEGDGKVAAVCCRVGKGTAVLWGTHPEFALTAEPLLSAVKKRWEPLSHEEIVESEACRWKALRRTLTLLGLKVPKEDDSNKAITPPLPQFLTSAFPSLLGRVYESLSATASTSTEPRILQDSNDTFRLHSSSSSAGSLLHEARNRGFEDPVEEKYLHLPKDIVTCLNGEIPPDELTPKFSISQYYKFLSDARASTSPKLKEYRDGSSSWGMGQLFLYGEVVTSTQTLLDRNHTFMRALPTPLLSLATHQLSGRGRGANVWVSPAGCLQFSLLLRLQPSQLPASRLVFVQYVFALAVVEACRRLLGQKAGERVRLKWPNDIYAVVDVEDNNNGRMKEEKKKMGGILVTTDFSQDEVNIVIGCGLNVLNPHPTTSLSQLTYTELSMEKAIATIMVVFEGMWETFVSSRGSFEPFMDLYLERWLHSDQLVTVTTVSPPVSVRIAGITSDYGQLRTLPVNRPNGEFIDLQPDGNSFDMMAGLIKRKT